MDHAIYLLRTGIQFADLRQIVRHRFGPLTGKFNIVIRRTPAAKKLCRATFFKVGLQKFTQLTEFPLLLRLQCERFVIKVEAADLDARDFLLGLNGPNDFLKRELSV